MEDLRHEKCISFKLAGGSQAWMIPSLAGAHLRSLWSAQPGGQDVGKLEHAR